MKRPTDKQQEHEWIERFLRGQMPEEEHTLFRSEMQADPSFQQEVDSLKRVHQLMEEAFLEQQAITTIKRLQVKHRIVTWRIRFASRSVGLMAAASVGLLFYLSIAAITFPGSENDISVTRSLADDSSVVAQQRVFGQFFEGQTHMTEGQYALAVRNFEQVLQVSDIRPYFREAAQWHLAVAYLKSGEPDKAERVYDQFAQCINCEYPISTINRWKIWWQIKWAQWLD